MTDGLTAIFVLHYIIAVPGLQSAAAAVRQTRIPSCQLSGGDAKPIRHDRAIVSGSGITVIVVVLVASRDRSRGRWEKGHRVCVGDVGSLRDCRVDGRERGGSDSNASLGCFVARVCGDVPNGLYAIGNTKVQIGAIRIDLRVEEIEV